jgi:hypothetical protein
MGLRHYPKIPWDRAPVTSYEKVTNMTIYSAGSVWDQADKGPFVRLDVLSASLGPSYYHIRQKAKLQFYTKGRYEFRHGEIGFDYATSKIQIQLEYYNCSKPYPTDFTCYPQASAAPILTDYLESISTASIWPGTTATGPVKLYYHRFTNLFIGWMEKEDTTADRDNTYIMFGIFYDHNAPTIPEDAHKQWPFSEGPKLNYPTGNTWMNLNGAKWVQGLYYLGDTSGTFGFTLTPSRQV